MSPTARSLAYCRKQGWHAGVVEKWVPVPDLPAKGVRRDLFGCFDLVVIVVEPRTAGSSSGWRPLDAIAHEATVGFPSIVGVQACAGASHAARRDKVAAAPVLPDWYAAGAAAEVWSWSKQGPRGKRKTWTLRRERVSPSPIEDEVNLLPVAADMAAQGDR